MVVVVVVVMASGDAPINASVTWQFLDVLSLVTAGLDSRLPSLPPRGTQEQGRFWTGILKGYGLNFNDNVSPSLAAHSWDYLSYLWLYAGLTILGTLVPLYKYIPEEELLYPDYEFDKEEADVKENPMTGIDQSYYDYDDAAEYNDMSSNQGDDYSNYQSGVQDYSSRGDSGNTNGYPPPKYYGIRHYPPPRH